MCELRLGVNYFYNDANDGYDILRNKMNSRFIDIVAGGGKIFTTAVSGLWDLFLDNLPENARQFYNCQACQHFFNRYARLVTITESGEVLSAVFDESETPKFFLKSVKAVKRAVLKARVDGVFVSEEKNLGYPTTGEYTHFYLEQPKSIRHKDRLKTAYQVSAEKREDFGMLNRVLEKFDLSVAEKALALINTGELYRGEKVKGVAEFFVNLHKTIQGSRNRNNLVWLAVATAPKGFAHINSGSFGTLLTDIKDGLSTRSIMTRFEEMMRGYMRSTSAPSENQTYHAERVVAELGLEDSLERRYAKIEEVPLMWQPKAVVTDKAVKRSGGVFGNVKTKEQLVTSSNPNLNSLNLPTSVMTWAKFQRTVLPTADSIEALVDNMGRIMAMTTAVNPNAENILQWDNPFSWYYHGGADGDIKQRVTEAGGRYENNEIRFSVAWEGLTDLDIHCRTPRGQHIYWSDKRSSCGGYLDLDMNGVDRQSTTPVENIRWAKNAPEGRYKFYVHNFNERVNHYNGTPFKAELEVNGQVYHAIGQPLGNKREVIVFEFDYKKGQQPRFLQRSIGSAGSAGSSSVDWSVQPNSFVKVTGVTTSPNLWGSNPVTHAGQHIFFLLDGVKDESEGKGRGFFNEHLKSELREIRKVLEAYTASTPIEDTDEATACGLGYSIDNEWNLTLKVTSGGSTRLIKIDRWD